MIKLLLETLNSIAHIELNFVMSHALLNKELNIQDYAVPCFHMCNNCKADLAAETK